MRVGWISSRQFQRRFLLSLILAAFTTLCLLPRRKHHVSPPELEARYPLLWRHVHMFNGTGGAWYIPPNWLSSADIQPETIVDAALLASQATISNKHRHMNHSSIPLLLHQTWKNRRIDTWSDLLRISVEQWLGHVVSDEMAYFFWEDDGILQLLTEFEPDFVSHFHSLPSNVERADVFRILVLKWFGGIYADVDTQPLRQPASWISETDLAPWADSDSDSVVSSDKSVHIVLGIEADCPPERNDYWRMGYLHSLQLTQWALASASGHPILLRFMDTLQRRLGYVASLHQGDIHAPEAVRELRRIGPVSLTGPGAVTVATKAWLEEQVGLQWNSLTGLRDGGLSKLVDDVLILPITGFSPGRGRYGNMGSKPVTDPAARVWHRAQGSWRAFDWQVEFGKTCRSLLGLCRDWPMQPS